MHTTDNPNDPVNALYTVQQTMLVGRRSYYHVGSHSLPYRVTGRNCLLSSKLYTVPERVSHFGHDQGLIAATDFVTIHGPEHPPDLKYTLLLPAIQDTTCAHLNAFIYTPARGPDPAANIVHRCKETVIANTNA